MTTAGDLLDSIKRAKATVTAAQEEQRKLELLLRDAKKAVAAAQRKYETAIDEALAERRQPSLFDAVEPMAATPAVPATELKPQGDASAWADLAPAVTTAADPAPLLAERAITRPLEPMQFATTQIPGLSDYVVSKLVKVGVTTVGELCAWADEKGELDGGMLDSNGVGLYGALCGLGIASRKASEAGDAVYAFLKQHGCDPRLPPTHGARVQLPDPRPIDSPQSQPAAPSATKLSALGNFPDAVADMLLPLGLSTVETLLEHMEGDSRDVKDMPLRNRLVAHLVLLGAKLKPAEHAAAAVAEHVEPGAKPAPEPDETRTVPDAPAPTPVGLGLLVGFPPAALKKLVKQGIRTLGELREKADSLPSTVDSDVRMYAVIRGAGVASAVAREAANKVLYRPTQATALELERASQKLKPNPKPYGWDITYMTNRFEERTCHFVGTEASARKKALLRPNAKEVTQCRPMTEAAYVRAFGRGRS